MIINPQVSLHRLVLSLSEALDHVSPSVADHQLRVAFMSTRMARLMGFTGQRLQGIFHAAALHDIGLIRPVNRVQAIVNNRLEGLGWHGEVGCELLKDNEFFSQAAPIVRYHHASWSDARANESDINAIPLEAYIVGLADAVDRFMQRDVPILYQMKRIREFVLKGKGRAFSPDCVEAFLEAGGAPAFWLDAASKRIYAILNREMDWPTLIISETTVEGIAQIFARLVDCLSPWTATHSAGVAATAVALADKMDFSPREQILMRAAGYLHDLGKITVPSEILDSPNKPTEEELAIIQGHTYYTFRILDTIGGMPQISEWAAFHHERLDGKGYPFGHRAKDLTLGSRIMAVADTFTAITEDRPYRKGMKDEESLNVMTYMTANGALDGEIVNVLRQNYDEIKGIRQDAQAAYAIKQRHLVQMMGLLPGMVGDSPQESATI
jgi:HD-GYP domain-containing protein (c-di-GMP phosphodiesterase class II)